MVDWNAMSLVRDDKSSFVAAQGTMGTGMAASLLKPNCIGPFVCSVVQRNARLDSAQEISIDRIQPRHPSTMLGFSHQLFLLWAFSVVDSTVNRINEIGLK
jgi:hypothetical protein